MADPGEIARAEGARAEGVQAEGVQAAVNPGVVDPAVVVQAGRARVPPGEVAVVRHALRRRPDLRLPPHHRRHAAPDPARSLVMMRDRVGHASRI